MLMESLTFCILAIKTCLYKSTVSVIEFHIIYILFVTIKIVPRSCTGTQNPSPHTSNSDKAKLPFNREKP